MFLSRKRKDLFWDPQFLTHPHLVAILAKSIPKIVMTIGKSMLGHQAWILTTTRIIDVGIQKMVPFAVPLTLLVPYFWAIYLCGSDIGIPSLRATTWWLPGTSYLPDGILSYCGWPCNPAAKPAGMLRNPVKILKNWDKLAGLCPFNVCHTSSTFVILALSWCLLGMFLWY